MTKRTLTVVLAVALALIGTGCNSSSSATPDVPVVSEQGANDGGTLKLSWDAAANAKSYEITAGDAVDTTEATSFDVTTPAAVIEVRSLNGSKKSDPATVDCKYVESTVEVLGDPTGTNDRGFGFNENGVAVRCTLAYPSMLKLNFYVQLFGTEMKLISGSSVNPDSSPGSAMRVASVEYDELKMADPLGDYSDSTLVITSGGTYCLRMSKDTSAVWSAADHFAKAKVVSIDSNKVTLNLGYQPIAGLRWLVK